MPFPGVTVTFGDAVPAAGAPTDTGQWFVAGLADRGPVGKALKVTSLSSFVSQFGDRQSYSVLYDAIETFFREGGTTAFVSRVVGPGATTASKTITGAASAASLTVKAKGPGSYGNSLKVAVLTGDDAGNFKLEITDGSTVVETSPDLADPAAAVQWSLSSSYVDVVADGVADPTVAAAAALSGGDDDRANITNTQHTDALAAFSKTLGPGQVSVPGTSNSTVNAGLLAHAEANNRVAVLDVASTDDTVAELKAVASALAADANASFGAVFGPWASIPGVVAGTTRSVPMSAVMAGLIAKSDRYRDAGEAVAGINSPYRFVVSFASFTDDEIEELVKAGVNPPKNIGGTLVNYGFRSVSTDADWLQFNYARLRMAITARLNSVAEGFVFKRIDGAGHTLIQFKDALSGVLGEFYVQGALYGDSPEEAFRVDTASVNDATTASNGELHAQVAVKLSPHAEAVLIDIAKTPLTQSI